jgi:hypothetical protein
MLPTVKTTPAVSLSNFTTLIYGKPKIGKSTFAAGFPSALFLDCEGGLQSLETFRLPIFTWADFLGACGELAQGNHDFKTVVVDTVDQAYQRCREHTLSSLNLKHESDGEIGKGWDMVSSEFLRVISKLALLPYGLVLISHAQEKEFKTRTGKQVKIVPTLPARAGRGVMGMVDLLLYADHESLESGRGVVTTERRVVRTKPTSYYDAGDRTGSLPETIPLEYGAFSEAFAKATAPQPVTSTAAVAPVAPRAKTSAVVETPEPATVG